MDAITVNFPLCGAWEVVTSPGDHVPSHYTDALGMTFAYDFSKPKDSNIPFLTRLVGVNVESCDAWNAEVISPLAGRVMEVKRNIQDRKKLFLFSDILSGIRAIFTNKNPKCLGSVFGNYVVIKSETCCFLLAHLKENSIKINVGDNVDAGDFVGRIGHCGSSQRPHLHFQLMDSPDVRRSIGIATNFNLERKVDEKIWEEMPSFIPLRHHIVRSANKSMHLTAKAAVD